MGCYLLEIHSLNDTMWSEFYRLWVGQINIYCFFNIPVIIIIKNKYSYQNYQGKFQQLALSGYFIIITSTRYLILIIKVTYCIKIKAANVLIDYLVIFASLINKYMFSPLLWRKPSETCFRRTSFTIVNDGLWRRPAKTIQPW